MSETNIFPEAKFKDVVDSYRAVIAASHKLIENPRKWELHNFARVLIGVDNGTDERYHSSTPEKKIEFYKELVSCEKDSRYAESFKAIDKLSGGKMSLLASQLTYNDDIDMVTAIEAVQSPEKSILSGKYSGGLIVYHGTAYHDVPFDKFEEDKPIWFTSDLSYAKGYAESRTGMMGKRAFENFEYFELDDFKYTRDDAKDMLRVNQDLRIARLDLKNPAIIGEPHDYLYPVKLILWLKDLSARLDIPFEELDSIKLPDYVGDWHNQNREVDTVDFIHNPDFMKILENHGYDGIVTTEYGNYHVYCYAAFHNDQIREITPNDQEWNLVDSDAKQLKAAYRASWVEEGHREEVFDTVEKIFKERPSISPKERLQGGFLDKCFEKMGIKLIDSVNDQAVKAARMGTIQQTDQNKQSDIVMEDKNLKNQNMTSDSESVRVQLYDELSKKLGLIMPKHGDGVYLAMPLRAAENSEKPMHIDRVYHDLGKKPGEFVCANMFYHVNMSDMSSVDLKNLIKVFDKKLHTNPNVTETKLNKATAAVKQAIHDRIVTPTARRFTSDQVESLTHYRSLFPADTDTGKLFTPLHEDVCKQEDVACKSEKWKSDALRELNDLAEGITREHGQGLKR